MTKHTPGPWHLDSEWTVRDNGGNEVASVAIGAQLFEAKTNGGVIAAAPDTFEACQLMAYAHDAWMEVVQYMNANGKAAPAAIALAMEKARTAVAKATGG